VWALKDTRHADLKSRKTALWNLKTRLWRGNKPEVGQKRGSRRQAAMSADFWTACNICSANPRAPNKQDNYRVARRPCGRPALSELGVKVSLHPAQALRTPLSEEIKAVLHVRNDCLLRREFKTSFLQELLDEGLDLSFQ